MHTLNLFSRLRKGGFGFLERTLAHTFRRVLTPNSLLIACTQNTHSLHRGGAQLCRPGSTRPSFFIRFLHIVILRLSELVMRE
jgi:hypothetical protein